MSDSAIGLLGPQADVCIHAGAALVHATCCVLQHSTTLTADLCQRYLGSFIRQSGVRSHIHYTPSVVMANSFFWTDYTFK